MGQWNLDWESITQEVYDWLESVRYTGDGEYGKWKYNRMMVRDYGVQSSGMALVILNQIGRLGNVGEARRAEAIRVFQSWQDPADGLFKDPLIKEGYKRVMDFHHTWEHVWNQVTGECVKGLRLLGAQPLYPLPTFAFVDFTQADPREWVLSLDWKERPWVAGEHFTRAVHAYRQNNGLMHEEDDIVRRAYETVETSILNEHTGLPDLLGCTVRSQLFAGLFKITGCYVPYGRRFPYIERAFDSVLSFQKENGEFDLGGMTLNWDALAIFYRLSPQISHSYRFDDIVGSARRCNRYLLDVYRKPDGGFSFEPDGCWMYHNSVYLSEKFPISDTVGTWMALECLLYQREWEGIR